MPTGTPLTRFLHLLLTLLLLPLKLFTSAKPYSTHHPTRASTPQTPLSSNPINHRESGRNRDSGRNPEPVDSPDTQESTTQHTDRDPVDLERGLPTHTYASPPTSSPPHSPVPSPVRPASRVSFAPPPHSKSYTGAEYGRALSAAAPHAHANPGAKGLGALPENDPPGGTAVAQTPSCEVEWWYWPLLPSPPASFPDQPTPTPTSPQPTPTPHASDHPASPHASNHPASPQRVNPHSNMTQPTSDVLQRPGLAVAFCVPMTFAVGPLSPGSGGTSTGSTISGVSSSGGTADRLFVGMIGATPRGCSTTIVDPTGPATPTGPSTTGPTTLRTHPASTTSPSPSPALKNGDNGLASSSPTHQPPFHPSPTGTSRSSPSLSPAPPTPPLSPLSPTSCPPNTHTPSSRPSHASFSPSFVFPTPLASSGTQTPSSNTQTPSSKAPLEEHVPNNTNSASTSSYPSSPELGHDSLESSHPSSAFEAGGISPSPSFPFRFDSSGRDDASSDFAQSRRDTLFDFAQSCRDAPFDFIQSRRDTPFTFVRPRKASVGSTTRRDDGTQHHGPTHRPSSPDLETTSSEHHGSASGASSACSSHGKHSSSSSHNHPFSSTQHEPSPSPSPLTHPNPNPHQRPDNLKRDKLHRRAYRFLQSNEHPHHPPPPLPKPSDDQITSETSSHALTWRAWRQSLLLPTLNLMYSPHGSFECDFGVWGGGGGCGEVVEGGFEDLGAGGEGMAHRKTGIEMEEEEEEEEGSPCGGENGTDEDERQGEGGFVGVGAAADTFLEDNSILGQAVNELSKIPKSSGNHEAMPSATGRCSETNREGPPEPATRALLHPSFSAPEAWYYGFYHEWYEGLGVYEGWSGEMESEGGAVCRGLYDGARGGFVGRGGVGFVRGGGEELGEKAQEQGAELQGDGDEEVDPLHSYPPRPFSLPDLICTDQETVVAQSFCGDGQRRGEGDQRRGKDRPGGENLNEVGYHIAQGLGDRLGPATLSPHRSHDASGRSGNASGKTLVRYSRLPTFVSLRRTSEFLLDVDVGVENEGVKGAGGEGVEENEEEWDENNRVGEEGVDCEYVRIAAQVEGAGEKYYRGYARKLDQGLNGRRVSTLSNGPTGLVPPAWVVTETSDLEETAESVTSYMSCQSFRSVV